MNRIAHLAIQVTEVAAPGRLLEAVFGFSHTGTVVHPTSNFSTSARSGGHTSRHLSDGVMDITLVKYDDEATAEPGSSRGKGPCIHHFGFEADDPAPYAAAIVAHGGEVLSAPDVPTLKFRAPGGIVAEVVPTGWHSREVIAANAERRRRGLPLVAVQRAPARRIAGEPAGERPRLTHIAMKVEDVVAVSTFFEGVFGLRVFSEYWQRDHLSRHLTDGALDLAIVKFDRDTEAAHASGSGPCIHHFGIDVAESEITHYKAALRKRGCEFVTDPGAVTVKFRLPGGGALGEIGPTGWHFRTKADG